MLFRIPALFRISKCSHSLFVSPVVTSILNGYSELALMRRNERITLFYISSIHGVAHEILPNPDVRKKPNRPT